MLKTGKTARAFLKACTDGAHQRLHKQPHFFRLQHGSATCQDYAELMTALLSFYRELDLSITCASHRHLNKNARYSYHPRAPMIEADVAAICERLKRPPSTPDAGLQTVMPIIANRSALAGVIYVVDGATLGGRLLNKAAGKLLGGEEAGGRSYWLWCETHGAAQWKAALALIDECGKDETDRSSMAASALATFTALERRLAVGATDAMAGAA